MFVCPLCRGSRWGSSAAPDGSRPRRCNTRHEGGRYCPFTWGEKDDALYGIWPPADDLPDTQKGS